MANKLMIPFSRFSLSSLPYKAARRIQEALARGPMLSSKRSSWCGILGSVSIILSGGLLVRTDLLLSAPDMKQNAGIKNISIHVPFVRVGSI